MRAARPDSMARSEWINSSMTVTASDGILSTDQEFTATVSVLVVDLEIGSPWPLTVSPTAEWLPASNISAWAGTSLYLVFVRITPVYGFSIEFDEVTAVIRVSDTLAGTDTGFDIPDGWETRAVAMRFRSPDIATDLILAGSAHPSHDSMDTTGPYQFRLNEASREAVEIWFTALEFPGRNGPGLIEAR